MARLRPVRHDEHLSIVEHLDELRSRLIVAGLSFVVAFGLAFWQKGPLLRIANDPLGGRKPITLAPAEAFMTTVTVAAYAALLLALPVILYQLYAFVLPAFSPAERRVALPLLVMVPVLFIGGAVFAYFVVLPPALKFLLNFDANNFHTMVRARDYYGFVGLTTISVGILFQVPVAILALTRLGIVTPRQLRRTRRYAILVIAVLAALLPSVDPVSMLIEMAPLIVLYELSILLASAFGRPSPDVAERVASAESS